MPCKKCGHLGELENGLCPSCKEEVFDEYERSEHRKKFLTTIFPEPKEEKEVTEEEFEDIKKKIKEAYPKIKMILQKYCDLDENHYNIISLWVIGTYLHKNFTSYPYLFFNAMRGSGKSRLLNLISHLSYNGELLVSMSESVLFRTAKDHTFCIDEFERVGSKDKSALRELLNAGYKKGMLVKRAKKIKGEQGEFYTTEKFEVFCPIAMANIWGMENVLSDRCIQLTLEKSNNPKITKLIELFENNNDINYIKDTLSVVCAVKLPLGNIYIHHWNDYILGSSNYTYNIHNIYKYNYTNNTLFKKIKETELDSRHLELFFPLFIISSICSEEILDETINTAKLIIKDRKSEDMIENRDISLFEFLSIKEKTEEFISISRLMTEFREFLKEEDENVKYINSKWLGRALKRLVLVKEKRRLGKGVEVRINFEKAIDKIKLFKETDQINDGDEEWVGIKK